MTFIVHDFWNVPFECKMATHDDAMGVAIRRHAAIARAWLSHQTEIEALLGRKPIAAGPDEEG